VSLAARRAPSSRSARTDVPRLAKKTATVKKKCHWTFRKIKVKGHTRKRKVKLCTSVKAPERVPAKRPVVVDARRAPAPVRKLATIAAALPTNTLVAPSTPPLPANEPVPVFTNPLTERHVERLLWRAGFGPAPRQTARLASQNLGAVVLGLTRPSGAASLNGPEPHADDGQPLAPADAWGHDHLSWLDRMIRSDQQFVERMALIWHDWFATSNAAVSSQRMMLDQAQMFRENALGSFDDLFTAVTSDPAMLIFLNGIANVKWNQNENYAREMMELFSLGAGRGAYTEADVREMARALTGFRNDWSAELGAYNFRYDPAFHDTGNKRIFGQTGNFSWADAVRLCVTHPLHASFFCIKLWSYFVPTSPDDATLASLQSVYVSSGRQIRPVVEAILMHPDFYEGPEMVIPPVVFTAGLLRATGRGIDTTAWSWLADFSGQRLFYPPNVAGWDDTRWLDTSTLRGRWLTAHYALQKQAINPWATPGYDPTEDAATAVTAAMAFLGNPTVSEETQRVIAAFADSSVSLAASTWNRGPHRAMRQNALRMLIATSPDAQVS
jgi:uncharacterized protein (DUF1800 family)